MARYTHYLKVALPKQQVQDEMAKALEACDLELLHRDDAYLVAREIPGRSALTQLVTVEVLVNDAPQAELAENSDDGQEVTKVDVVFKNEELPLSRNNHCSQVYRQVQQVLTEERNWQLIGNIAGA